MSLVERVMREAVEKRSISALPKETTFSNTRRRRFMPIRAAAREASRPVRMAAATITRERASIRPPVASRYRV